jgi:hypothetical protein
MSKIEEKFTSTIGSGGFVECELTNDLKVKKIKMEEDERVVKEIRDYYNSYETINGRPPSKKFFNEFLDTFFKK